MRLALREVRVDKGGAGRRQAHQGRMGERSSGEMSRPLTVKGELAEQKVLMRELEVREEGRWSRRGDLTREIRSLASEKVYHLWPG